MDLRQTDPKVAMGLYVVKKERLVQVGATEDMLIVQAYDALGEAHGRSEEGFKWALDIPNALDFTKVLNLRGVSRLHGEQYWP